MKTSLLILSLAALCAAPSAFGQGAAVIIKQRAKQTAGRPAPAPATAVQPRAGGAVAPQSASASGQPNVSKLVGDLASIKSRPEASPEQKSKLATDLAGVASTAQKPSTEAVQTLANALADAIAGKKIAAADQAQLARSLGQALMAGAGSPQFSAAVQGVKDGLTVAGVNDAGIQSVAQALLGLSTKAK